MKTSDHQRPVLLWLSVSSFSDSLEEISTLGSSFTSQAACAQAEPVSQGVMTPGTSTYPLLSSQSREPNQMTNRAQKKPASHRRTFMKSQ